MAKTDEIRQQLAEAQRKRHFCSQHMDQLGVAQYDAQIAELEANLARSETLAAKAQSKQSSQSTANASTTSLVLGYAGGHGRKTQQDTRRRAQSFE